MNDLVLRQDILDELGFDPKVEAAHIGVVVDKGVVTLTGHVSNYAEKLAAEAAVRRVKGVRAVAEELEVRVPNHRKTADDEIATRAADIMSWDSALPKDRIRITVHGGWLYLEGEVDWQFQRTAAQERISQLTGLVGVVNNITIRNQPVLPDIRRRIEEAFRRNAEVDAEQIHVAVHDNGKVVLEGNVHGWSERAAAENAVWGVSGVTRLESNLRIV
ncbi:MAG TPA: BON domain-containing protein [Rhizomicrobium sp.]|nr:BON domain-containing protein [Rhizomicrobium sp.]